VTDILQEII